jgi:hypothetical protein
VRGHRVLELSGGHEWPPAEALTEAITWIEALERFRASGEEEIR